MLGSASSFAFSVGLFGFVGMAFNFSRRERRRSIRVHRRADLLAFDAACCLRHDFSRILRRKNQRGVILRWIGALGALGFLGNNNRGEWRDWDCRRWGRNSQHRGGGSRHRSHTIGDTSRSNRRSEIGD